MERTTKGWKLTTDNRLGTNGLLQVYKVDSKTVVKLTDPPRLAEAEALRFVRKWTSLPVPEVYEAYVDETLNRGVLVMEYCEGDVLRDVWDDLAEEVKTGIISQLRDYLDELRSIGSEFVGSVDGSPCEDPIFSAELGGFGPYDNEEEFHRGIIRALDLAEDGPWARQAAGFVSALPSHELVLTHADLTPRNIIIRDGKVVGIIDWEMAGFYPAYWEYVKALYHPDWTMGWFNEAVVNKILTPYPLEHAVMMHVHHLL
ncbi:kinase-like protein [Aspergillus heteromorphus CBS 117.55]|uniref:Kinase-like protein n=1 Tax=Aspergillus heteromorphus CBS 117.55 TaxID=1448321 RepID=A0A317WSL8_9EURO|nr:kinase-like protein [Aspergillus heteromorphus CBS 117.55]PWY88147.1 kinase-like protein [Aspergillus heteromorphus CBS 117.55]